jgi:hypothetical protein
LALTVGLTVLPAARADNLDDALLAQARQVMQFLKDRHYRNVGVLKFRASIGNQPLAFRVGPINTNLASRLENALVLLNDKAQPIGIIHDASKVALDNRLPSYSTDAGMAKLFQLRFPLAWEAPPVSADAFLTGTVRAAADMRTATVTIQAFENKATKLEQVVRFTVPVDRPLLNDLGQSFALSTRALKKGKTKRALDLEAADDAAERDQAPPSPGGQVTLPSAEKLVDFQIRYDGRPQPYSPDPQSGGELKVAEPRQGQRVTFVLRNLTQETLGVVVMVNGKNVLFEQELEPVKCHMWLPGPGKEIEIKGFQMDEKTVKPFRVLSPGESEAMSLTDNLGLIGVYVFRSMKDRAPDAVTPGAGTDGELTVTASGRSLRNPAGKVTRARSLAERQKQLSASKTSKKRGVIVGGETKERFDVRVYEFVNPEQQQALVIRYFNPKGR